MEQLTGFSPPPQNQTEQTNIEHEILVAMPGRPGETVSLGLLSSTHNSGVSGVEYKAQCCSLLTTNFNILWCYGLNNRPRVKRFCLIHDDVVPEPFWLLKLLIEMDRLKADVISACIPLKDERGLTSTGYMNWNTREITKLSVRETLELPKTFSIEDIKGVSSKDHCLILNSGLLLCDFTKPWVEKMVFRQHDTIVKDPDGQFVPLGVSEDWLFSIDAARMGLSCYATTLVNLYHDGKFRYPNYVPWGSEDKKVNNVTSITYNIDPPSKPDIDVFQEYPKNTLIVK